MAKFDEGDADFWVLIAVYAAITVAGVFFHMLAWQDHDNRNLPTCKEIP